MEVVEVLPIPVELVLLLDILEEVVDDLRHGRVMEQTGEVMLVVV